MNIVVKAIRILIRRVFLLGLPKDGHHITRYSMYGSLSGLLKNHRPNSRVLCISDSGELVRVLGLKDVELVVANYPDHTIIDLHKFPDASFDYIVSDQVLEHIEGDPKLAFKESHRVLRPGGIAVHTTCFINPIHEYPVDLWRFTPYALRYLAADFSEVIEVNGWGNRGVWIVEWLGLRFHPVPSMSWHPLNKIATANNDLWPVSTWVVARK